VKRSICDQCKKKYILRTDRRPTDLAFGPYWGNFKRPYLCKGSSDPLHVWFYGGVFEVGGSNGAISGFAKSKMAARPPSWKIQMAISQRRIVWFTECLVLGCGFWVGGSNGANSFLTKFNRYVGENNARGVSRLVTIWSISCCGIITLRDSSALMKDTNTAVLSAPDNQMSKLKFLTLNRYPASKHLA